MKGVPDTQLFDHKAKELFGTFLTSLGYQYRGTTEKECSVVLTYLNKELQQTVDIRNETCYVDYGFSIFVSRAGDEQQNILYHVPWENQDSDGLFLQRAFDKIRGEQTLVDLLSGKTWTLFDRIYFQE
jgi:hypothetical protein